MRFILQKREGAPTVRLRLFFRDSQTASPNNIMALSITSKTRTETELVLEQKQTWMIANKIR